MHRAFRERFSARLPARSWIASLRSQ